MITRLIPLALVLSLPLASASMAASCPHGAVRSGDRQMYAHRYGAPVAARDRFVPAAPETDSRDPLTASANGS